MVGRHAGIAEATTAARRSALLTQFAFGCDRRTHMFTAPSQEAMSEFGESTGSDAQRTIDRRYLEAGHVSSRIGRRRVSGRLTEIPRLHLLLERVGVQAVDVEGGGERPMSGVEMFSSALQRQGQTKLNSQLGAFFRGSR